jgi:hypothetical protein
MFDRAHEVRSVAANIIFNHHPHLEDAYNEDLIGFYFKGGNNDWAGKAKKCTAFERFSTSHILFVFIDERAWKVYSEPQRRALVDHELCHFTRQKTMEYNPETQKQEPKWCDADDPDNWGIRDHDVEEFSEIISRHGLWETGIERFASAVRSADYQMTIEDIEEGMDDEPEEQPMKAYSVDRGGVVALKKSGDGKGGDAA